jgi:hypothetical protein
LLEWLINLGLKIFLFFRIFALFQLYIVLSELQVGKWIRYLFGLIIPTVIGTLLYTWYFFPSHFFEHLFSYTLFFWISIEIFYAFINPIIRYIPTIMGLIFSFISVNVTILFLIISFWVIETFAIGGFTAIHYIGHTDVMFNPNEKLLYQIITGALFSYAVLLGSGGWLILSPSFHNEQLSPLIRRFATNTFFVIVFAVTSFSLFIMSNKLVESNDLFGLLNTTSDVDAKQIIDDISLLENEYLNKLEISEKNISAIKKGFPYQIEYFDLIDSVYKEKYIALIIGDQLKIVEYLNKFNTGLDTSEVAMILTLQTHLIFDADVISDSDTIPKWYKEKTVNIYESLIMTEFSSWVFEKKRIELLLEFYPKLYIINEADEKKSDKHINVIREYLEDTINYTFETDPIFALYCYSWLSDYYIKMGKFHRAEKILMKAMYLLKNNMDLVEYSEIELSYLFNASERIKLVLAESISKQRTGEFSVELFKNTINEIENNLNDADFSFFAYRWTYRYHNEFAIATLGEYLNNEINLSESTQYLVLSFIERNKARVFKKKLQVDWIHSPPKLNKSEVGLNYIIGFNTILGQIYTADSCYSFSGDLSLMKESWEFIQLQISNNIHPEKELVQSLCDVLIPPELQYLIYDKKLYLSPDGEISEIPFQYILRDFKNKSITVLPGFSFLNLNNTKKETICALSARSPSYSNKNISNQILLGMRGSDISPLLFANQEVQNIGRIYNSLNYSNATVIENVSESWVKRNIESFDIIHFAAHSSPFISEVNEGAILLVSSSEDDGILSTSEIASLTLENKLVFLSSCETNVGDFIPGEGINSIARSLLFAGADGVIASLWPVNDKTAVSITDQFYSLYLKTNDPAIAIYQAQELVFSNNPHYSPSQSFPFIYISK